MDVTPSVAAPATALRACRADSSRLLLRCANRCRSVRGPCPAACWFLALAPRSGRRARRPSAGTIKDAQKAQPHRTERSEYEPRADDSRWARSSRGTQRAATSNRELRSMRRATFQRPRAPHGLICRPVRHKRRRLPADRRPLSADRRRPAAGRDAEAERRCRRWRLPACRGAPGIGDVLLAVRRLATPNLRLAGRERPDREGGPVSREDTHRAETSRRSCR